MGNHNVRITDPKGNVRLQFADNITLREAQKWVREYSPAPIGWEFRAVNNGIRPKRKRPEYTLIQGWGPVLNCETGESEMQKLDERKAHVQTNTGKWYTPKMAKRDARSLGATEFKRKKVWRVV